MTVPRATGWSVATLALTCVLASGCTGSTNCASVGLSNGVNIRIEMTPGVRDQVQSITVCLTGDCGTITPPASFAFIDSLDSDPAVLTVRVNTADGKTLVSGSLTVQPKKFQPAPKCPQSAWTASIVITDSAVRPA